MGGPAAAADVVSATGPANAVRKQVTAVFADLVGSTSFGEQVDPEAARSSMAGYFDLLRSTIEDHAGTVAKFTGDGVMAIFGVPEVAEDDALRAVAAGQALQVRFTAFADQVRDRHGVELGLRVGVNTGELVIGADDADMVGDVLNTAARLEAACHPGRVLVGEDTWRLTRSSITYEVLGEVRVKGKADALATFQVVDGANRSVEDATPFVGRQVELGQLHAAFDDALASHMARLVTVIGAPGVGKTRLASELRSSAQARSFDLRFERRGSTTFTPIVELLRELTGSGTVEDVDRLVAAHPDAKRLSGVLASFLGHGEARSTEESFWAVRRLLELLAAESPLIIVVDDIQWAEPLFWDLLDHLVEWTEAPVLLVALARPELRELRPELAQAGRRVSASISVEGLDAATTRELAAKLLDTDELPGDLIERLPDSTEGNPLFVRELVQMLVDDGVLARTGDRWHLTIDIDAIEVPPTILSLLASRVERLPDDERQVVELASVIGTEFDRGALSAIAGGDIATRLGALIDRLRRKDLVEPSGSWAGDHPVYRFHHVLVRDAAYRRLLKGHRAELHERVGRHIESLAGVGDDSSDETDVVIAYHFEQVYQYRSELGTVDDATRALAAQATARLESATNQALAREDLTSAGGYALRALALTGADDGSKRDELLLLGCEALLESGAVGRGAPLVDELYERSSDERLAAWADCFRAQLWSLTDPDRLVEATNITASAAEQLAALEDSPGVAKARLVRASCLARLGRVGECEVELDLALGAAREAGDRRRTVAVLGASPLAALWGPSPVARAGGRCLDVLRLLRITATSPAVEATSIRCQGVLEALRGRFDSAREKLEVSRTTARELGLRQGLYETELFAGFVELWADDPVAAEPHLRLAQEGLGRQGIAADAGQAGALLARALLLQGHVDEADELASAALESAGQNLQTAIASRAALAEIRATQGRHQEAQELADQGVQIAERTDVVLDHALALLAADRVATAADRSADAQASRRQASELFERKGVARDADSAATVDEQPLASSSPSLREHTEHVEPADVEPAQAGVDELSGGGSALTNTATEITKASVAAIWTGDRAKALSFGADGFEAINHAGTEHSVWAHQTFAHEQLIDLLQAVVTDGGELRSSDVIAIRGDDRCLVQTTVLLDDAERVYLTLVRTDSGLITRQDWYSPDQLQKALNELDRRWFESLGFAGDEWFVNAWPRSYTFDVAAMAEHFQPNLEFIDHRTLRGDFRGGAEPIEATIASVDAGTSVNIPRIYRLDSHGAIYERVETDPAGVGDISMVMLLHFENEKIRRLETFELEDVDAAIARLDQLVQPSPHLENHATETHSQLTERHNAGDHASALELFSPSLVWSGRRASAPHIDGGIETAHQVTSEWSASGVDTIAFDVVAVRDDDLCLTRNVYSGDGAELSFVIVNQVDEGGLIVHWASFDADQIAEAQIFLDGLWFDALGLAGDHPVREVGAAVYSVDPEELLAAAHPEIEYREHRRLSFAVGGAYDQLAVNTSTMSLIDHCVMPVVHRISEHGVLIQKDEVGAAGETMSFLLVTSFRDGLCGSYDLYDLEDLDVAIARYDGLVAERERSQPRPFLTNAAYELGERVAQELIGGAPIEQYFTDDFRGDNRRAAHEVLDPGTRDAAAFLTNLRSSVSRDGADSSDRRAVAVRGEDLLLARVTTTFEAGAAEITILRLGQQRDGRFVRMTIFGEDQLQDALDELDQRWFESLGFAGDEWFITAWPLVYTHDVDRMEGFLHADLEFVDHRKLWGNLSGGLDVLTQVAISHGSGTRSIVTKIFQIGGHGAIYERVEVDPGSIGETPLIHVNVVKDNKIRHIELFDPEDLDAALARFEELVASATGQVARTPVNAATRVIDEYTAAINDGDLERFRSAFHSAARQELHHRIRVADVVDSDGITSLGRSIIAGNGVVTCEPIAIFGDHLAVCTQTLSFGPDEIRECSVVEVDGGVITRVISFDDDRLPEALDTFGRRAVELGKPAAMADIEITVRAAHWQHDIEAFKQLLDPSWTFHDQRSLGVGRMNLQEYLASSFPIRPADVIFWTVQVLAHTDSVALTHDRWRTADGSSWDNLHVGAFRLGIQQSANTFDLDDLDAALARYDEIVGAHANPLPEFTNTAYELCIDFSAAINALDSERMQALLHPDFVMHAGSVFAGDDVEATRAVEFYLTGPSTGQVLSIELVAVRGDDLCLVRLINTTGDYVNEYLGVITARGGQMVTHTWYEDTQLTDAQLELDRLYAASSGRADGWYRNRFQADMASLDIERVRPWLHPEFGFKDHRELGWPELDGEGWLGQMMGSIPPDMSSGTHRVLLTTASGSVTHASISSADGSVTIPSIMLVLFRDEQLIRVEMFDPHDDEVAIARFHELTSMSSPGVPEVANQASAAWAAWGDAWRNDGLSAIEPLLHTGFRFEARRASVPSFGGDRSDYLSALSMFESEGLADLTIEVIAVRGDRLVLSEAILITSAGDELRLLNIGESADDGTVIRATTFDTHQLDEALDELDRQWIELGGPAVAATRTGQVATALSSGPHDEFFAMFAAGFQVVDHRPMGFGTRNRDEFVASIEVLIGKVTAWTAVVLEVDERATLTRVEMRSTEDDTAWSLFLITTYDGDLVDRWEEFALNDLDAALDRYREVVAERSIISPLTNTATEVSKQFELALKARDLDLLREMFHPDYKRTMREKFRTQDTWAIDGEIDFLRGLVDVKGVIDLEPIAIRGDDLCALSAVIGAEHTNVNAHAVAVVRDGLILELITFDDAQLDEALAELDRLWLASGDRLDEAETPVVANRAWERHLELMDAFRARDRKRCRAVLGKNFTAIPRHSLSMGESYGIDAFLGLLFDNDDLQLSAENRTTILLDVRGDDLCLYRAEEDMDGYIGVGYWIWDTGSSRLFRYDDKQLDEARNDLEKLWAAANAPVDPAPPMG